MHVCPKCPLVLLSAHQDLEYWKRCTVCGHCEPCKAEDLPKEAQEDMAKNPMKAKAHTVNKPKIIPKKRLLD